MLKNKLNICRILLCVFTFVISFFMYSCSNNESSGNILKTHYNISFYMDDGYTLFKEQAFKEGDKIVLSENPSKDSTSDAKFIFKGWSLEIGGEVEDDIIADKTKVLYAVFLAIPVDKTLVSIPSVNESTFYYTGDVVEYILVKSDYYNISGAYQTNAGQYKVIVSLKDRENTIWDDGTIENKYYDFIINKAENTWVEEPTLSDWKVENGNNSPSGSSKFGEVIFTYSDSLNGKYTSNLPAVIGEYYMKATVSGSDNYSSLEFIVSFTISTDILPTYEIKFLDVDNTLLDSQLITQGEEVHYLGSALGVEGNNFNTALIGWEYNGVCYEEELPLVTENRNYYAVYNTELRTDKGTSDNPYDFSSVEEFLYLQEVIASGYNANGKYFVLNNNIDLTNTKFASIGTKSNPFNGNFDFNNYEVKYDINAEVVGLFGYNSGDIKNLNVFVNARSTDVAGGVAAYNYGTISSSKVSGNIDALNTVGGIVGINDGSILFSKSLAIVSKNNAYCANSYVGNNGIGYLVGQALSNHTLTLTTSIWDGSIADGYAGGDGSETNPYLISTSSELAYFKDNTNSANSYYKNKYFKLTNDIDLNHLIWTGIGSGTGPGGFAGTFDGNGYVIYNVNVNAGTTKNRGFFNSCAYGSNIKNVVIYGKVTSRATYSSLLSAINYANISNCFVFGSVESNAKYSGLLTAWNGKANISDCTTYGTLTGSDTVGSIAGYNCVSENIIGLITNCKNFATVKSTALGTATDSGVGGILGVVGSNSTISKCINYGEVLTTVNSNAGVGGIVGNLYTTKILECKNYGTITGLNAVGGIVGYARANGTISNCENNGVVSGSQNIGGISGENRSNISDCVNNGKVTVSENGEGHWIGGVAGMSGSAATIKKCTNNGEVIGIGSSTGGVGGIIGGLYGALSECINNGSVKGKYYLGGIVGSLQNAGAAVTNSTNNGVVITTVTKGTVNLGCIVGYNTGKVSNNSNYGYYQLPSNNSCINYDYIVGYDTVGETGVYNNQNFYNN